MRFTMGFITALPFFGRTVENSSLALGKRQGMSALRSCVSRYTSIASSPVKFGSWHNLNCTAIVRISGHPAIYIGQPRCLLARAHSDSPLSDSAAREFKVPTPAREWGEGLGAHEVATNATTTTGNGKPDVPKGKQAKMSTGRPRADRAQWQGTSAD